MFLLSHPEGFLAHVYDQVISPFKIFTMKNPPQVVLVLYYMVKVKYRDTKSPRNNFKEE